jgi:hypothetical protein
VTKEVLVTTAIRKGGGKRISVSTWMGHKVGRSDRERPFQDQVVVGEEVTKSFLIRIQRKVQSLFRDRYGWVGDLRENR